MISNFDQQKWLAAISQFAHEENDLESFEDIGGYSEEINGVYIAALILDAEEILENGDSLIPADKIGYSSDDIQLAKEQYNEFEKSANLANPTIESVAKLLGLPASLRKFMTYYQEIIAVHEAAGHEGESGAFTASFNQLSRNADRSRRILADAQNLITRLEHTLNPANYLLQSSQPVGIDAQP